MVIHQPPNGSITFPKIKGPPRADAGAGPPRQLRRPAPRLGDRIESALESLGVTKERYAAAKAAIGLPATCNCAKRQAWLNQLDEELQLGEKLAAFKKALGW